jgi:predicted dienelactone hydrolase
MLFVYQFKKYLGDRMHRRALVFGLTSSLCSTRPAKADFGDAIETQVILLTAGDGRQFETLVRWPKGARGALPLIVFSHGLGSNMDAFRETTVAWARAGYITVQPTHADSIRPSPLRTKIGEDLAGVMRALALGAADGAARAELVSRLEKPEYLDSRLVDINKVISAALTGDGWPNSAPRVDSKRIGMAGHSYGAYTTLALAGAAIFTGGIRRNLADPRLSAFMVISGQGPGRMGLEPRSFDSLSGPVLWISGSKDYGANGETPSWRLEPWTLTPPQDKYKLFVDGARHTDFDAPPGAPEVTETLHAREINFWNAYLKGSRRDRKALTAPTPAGVICIRR